MTLDSECFLLIDAQHVVAKYNEDRFPPSRVGLRLDGASGCGGELLRRVSLPFLCFFSFCFISA